MKWMGMRSFSYWTAQLAAYTLKTLIIAIVCGAIGAHRVFQRTTFGVLFVTLLLYGQTLFGLLWICASMFDNPQTASTLFVGLLWLMLLVELPIDILYSQSPSQLVKTMLCVGNPMLTIKQTFRVIVTYDNAGLAVDFSNGWTQMRKQFCLSQGLALLAVNAILYLVIAAFIEATIADVSGKDNRWFLWPSSTCKTVYNPEQACLQIPKLQKTFKDRVIIDCNDVSISENQVIALHADNGQGKTILMHELLNSFQSVAVGQHKSCCGRTIQLDVGFVPETVTLFENLTPIEHLELYRRLKGLIFFGEERQSELLRLEELLRSLGFDMGDTRLPDIHKLEALHLSSANRKLLQIAIAISLEP